MKWFAVDPDGSGSSCNACCCQEASIAPGVTDKWRIDWSRWAHVFGQGLVQGPSFDLELLTPGPLGAGNQSPTNTNYQFTLAYNGTLTNTVAVNADDPEGQPLTFSLLPLYGPRNGVLALNPNGSFTYTPRADFVGYDNFYFRTSDGVSRPVVHQVQITVNPPSPTPALPAPPQLPLLHFPQDRIVVRDPWTDLTVQASPALTVGDVYRLNIRQAALDCDGSVFYKPMCIDIRIASC